MWATTPGTAGSLLFYFLLLVLCTCAQADWSQELPNAIVSAVAHQSSKPVTQRHGDQDLSC